MVGLRRHEFDKGDVKNDVEDDDDDDEEDDDTGDDGVTTAHDDHGDSNDKEKLKIR